MNFLYKYLIPLAQAEEVQRIKTAEGVLNAFDRIVDLFTSIIVVLAIIYIIYNGFMFVSANGDENKISAAKKQIIYSFIAIILIILAGSAFRIVGDLITGVDNKSSNQQTLPSGYSSLNRIGSDCVFVDSYGVTHPASEFYGTYWLTNNHPDCNP